MTYACPHLSSAVGLDHSGAGQTANIPVLDMTSNIPVSMDVFVYLTPPLRRRGLAIARDELPVLVV